MRLLLLILLALLPLQAWANGKKTNLSIGFHLETDQGASKKLVFEHKVAGKKRFFTKTPVLSQRDFIAFDTFPSADGTFGVSFLVKPTPAKRFNALMLQAKGKYLLASVNGRFPDLVYIDEPIADQTIVIWRGITAPEIKQYDELLPRIGELRRAHEEKNKKKRK